MTLVCRVVEDIGRSPSASSGTCPALIRNRLLHAMWREAIHLVEQGVASPADIDRVARLSFGLRQPAVGPFENMDLVGLDLIHTIQSYLFPIWPRPPAAAPGHRPPRARRAGYAHRPRLLRLAHERPE